MPVAAVLISLQCTSINTAHQNVYIYTYVFTCVYMYVYQVLRIYICKCTYTCTQTHCSIIKYNNYLK